MEKKKKILVLLGHPNNDSFCGSLAEAYFEAAKAAGAEIRFSRIANMNFEPNLKLGFKAIQELEPDLKQFQQDILWAEHFVLVSPMWWGGLPAILQGLFDRTLLPGFAFKFIEGKAFQQKLLKGRTSRALITMDTPKWYYHLILGAPLNKRLRKQILKFCGFKPARINIFGAVGQLKDADRLKMIANAKKLGQRMA